MSEINAGGVAGELTLKVDQFIAPLRAAVVETKTAGKTITEGLQAASKSAATELVGLGAATTEAGTHARDASGKFVSLGKTIGETATAAGTAEGGLGGMSGGLRALAGVAGSINPQIGQMVSGFTAADGAASAMGVSLGVAIPIVGGLVAGLVALKTAAEFGLGGVKLAADMEQTSLSFEVMIGNAGKARDTLVALKRFADTTPFQFPEVASAAKQLLAMGIDSAELATKLRMLGDVSSGLGQPLGEMAYLFGQIRSQGRAMTQDLNQFAGRGVPIYTELARVLGTTELGVRSLAENGKIGFAEINAAFEAMTGEGGKFFEMTTRQGGTLNGELSTLADAWSTMQRNVGAAIASNLEFKAAVAAITEAVNDFGPMAVTAFSDGTKWLKDMWQGSEDFRGSFSLIIKEVREYQALLQELEGNSDSLLSKSAKLLEAIGTPWGQLKIMFQSLALTMKPVFELIGWIHEKLSDVDKDLAAINWMDEHGTEVANNNGQAQTPEERARGLPKAAAAGANKPAAAAPGNAGAAVGATPAKPGEPSKTETPAEKEAGRAAKEIADSLARAKDIALDAQVQALRNAGDDEKADLLKLQGKSQKQYAKAATKEERDAIESQYRQEYAGIVDSHNQKAGAKEDEEFDREAKRITEALQRGKKTAQDAEQKTLEDAAAARIAGDRTAGDNDKAERDELEEKWRKKSVGLPGTGAERDETLKAYEAEKAELLAKQQERAAKKQEEAADKLHGSAQLLGKVAEQQLSQQTAGDLARAFRDTGSWDSMMGVGGRGTNAHSREQSARNHSAFQQMNSLAIGIPREGAWAMQIPEVSSPRLTIPSVSGPSRARAARYAAAASSPAATGDTSAPQLGPVNVNVDAKAMIAEATKAFTEIAQNLVDGHKRELAAAKYAHHARGGT